MFSRIRDSELLIDKINEMVENHNQLCKTVAELQRQLDSLNQRVYEMKLEITERNREE